ncbi:MAG: hypothetical protein IT302_07525 [Dehalococcoidia bacterium]|nr:hypothetical protein [Dehalococcoidia bacterium]
MGLLKREAASLGAWLLMVLQWLFGGVGIALGYWLSGLAYAVGLWPVGALMRISLLLALITWLLYGVTVVFAFFALMAGGLREPSD